MSHKQTESNLTKRSFEELDDVIEEIIERNPDFVKQVEELINGTQTKDS